MNCTLSVYTLSVPERGTIRQLHHTHAWLNRYAFLAYHPGVNRAAGAFVPDKFVPRSCRKENNLSHTETISVSLHMRSESRKIAIICHDISMRFSEHVLSEGFNLKKKKKSFSNSGPEHPYRCVYLRGRLVTINLNRRLPPCAQTCPLQTVEF